MHCLFFQLGESLPGGCMGHSLVGRVGFEQRTVMQRYRAACVRWWTGFCAAKSKSRWFLITQDSLIERSHSWPLGSLADKLCLSMDGSVWAAQWPLWPADHPVLVRDSRFPFAGSGTWAIRAIRFWVQRLVGEWSRSSCRRLVGKQARWLSEMSLLPRSRVESIAAP